MRYLTKNLLIWILAVATLTTFFASMDFVEWIVESTKEYEEWELDELVFALPTSFAIGLCWMLFLHNRSLRHTLSERTILEQKLRASHDSMEERVTERTAEIISTNQQLTKTIDDLARTQQSLGALNATFMLLGADPKKNIHSLVAAAANILGGACSLYHRLEESSDSLCVWSKSQAPADLPLSDTPAGHICYEAVIKGENAPVVIEDLEGTPYETSDPNVQKYGLRSYIGYPVAVNGSAIGALCVVDVHPRAFKPLEVHTISALAKAISLEEERLQAINGLGIARADAEAAKQARGEFLANMSHEIRTPLNGILGMLQMIRLGTLDKEQHEYVETAMESARGLLALINDILDFSKIDAQKVEPTVSSFRPRDILGGVVRALKVQAEARNNTLTYEVDDAIPEWLCSDGGRLRQMLFNLMGNAVKFTKNGSIDLMAKLLPPMQDGRMRLLIIISDTGIGIPENKISTIFAPFVQVDGSFRRSHDGSGLGLAIVSKLVRLLGGGMAVSSAEGEGTEIGLVLPMDVGMGIIGTNGNDENKVLSSGKLPHLRLLLAEDNRVNRIAPQRWLERQGHHVTCAEDGQQALEKLTEQQFDVVLMDIQMPRMDGVEVTHRLRMGEGMEENRNIPVVALTAHAMRGDREAFLAAGLDGYLTKPLDLPDLENELRRVLSDPTS